MALDALEGGVARGVVARAADGARVVGEAHALEAARGQVEAREVHAGGARTRAEDVELDLVRECRHWCAATQHHTARQCKHRCSLCRLHFQSCEHRHLVVALVCVSKLHVQSAQHKKRP